MKSGGTTLIGLWLFELGNEVITAYKKKMVNTHTRALSIRVDKRNVGSIVKEIWNSSGTPLTQLD